MVDDRDRGMVGPWTSGCAGQQGEGQWGGGVIGVVLHTHK
jgi:hypothetical protein